MTAIAIVAIISWAIVSIVRTLKSKHVESSQYKGETKARISALESEIARMQERIVVLEKIVTDSNYDLKKQFEDLEKDKVA